MRDVQRIRNLSSRPERLRARDQALQRHAGGGLPLARHFIHVQPSYFLISEVQFKIAVMGSATLTRVSLGMMNF